MNAAEKSLEAVKNCIALINRADTKGAEAFAVAQSLAWLNCCKEQFEAELAKPDEVAGDKASA